MCGWKTYRWERVGLHEGSCGSWTGWYSQKMKISDHKKKNTKKLKLKLTKKNGCNEGTCACERSLLNLPLNFRIEHCVWGGPLKFPDDFFARPLFADMSDEALC